MTRFAMRSVLVLPSAIALTAGILAAPAAAAGVADGPRASAAALPSCTHFTDIKVSKGVVRYPSVGANTKDIKCKLQLGDHNWGVVALQQWLRFCNDAKQVEVDGIYGPVTRDVILWLQASKGIPADGVYGPQTMEILGKAVYQGNTRVGCSA
ncbi:peptidoglycan-binding domain-containing protein [Actinomadura sp. 7K507]|uniref:peptidoglycan-binding domain-containing protein n=1 Tax=Actinomadura sp. 7K507 TaxID=2530365 RepID=UPI0010456F7D|nr:peptidoglycan-binding domain-containing protein [Actinomadura sp. 7K507]TDC87774.1 peptidoglycan-binding protein [Actinomadura sp. 7K507]